jgi:hypothetical protein
MQFIIASVCFLDLLSLKEKVCLNHISANMKYNENGAWCFAPACAGRSASLFLCFLFERKLAKKCLAVAMP